MKALSQRVFKLIFFLIMMCMQGFWPQLCGVRLVQSSVGSSAIVDPIDEIHHFLDDLSRKSHGKQSESLNDIKRVFKLFEKKIKGIDLDTYVHEQFGRPISAKFKQGALTILFGIVAACIYGILHDSVTARLCIDYFNSPAHGGHYRMMQALGFEHPENETSPSKIAFLFGIVATWWVGAILGTGIAVVSQVGDELPPVEIKDFIVPLITLFGVMGTGSFIAGLLGYAFSFKSPLMLNEELERLDDKTYSLFMGVGCAHNTAYVLGGLGGLYLMFWSIKKRHSLAREAMRKNILDVLEELNKKITPSEIQKTS